jgi:putative FmdB family regulatory protein
MPTYVYECKACGKNLEVEQRMSDAPLTDCDCDQKGELKRVMQAAGISFKGSGFYVNEAPSCSGNPTSCGKCSDPTN